MANPSLDELFARMQDAALRREQEAEAERSSGTPWEQAQGGPAQPGERSCRCGRSGGLFVATKGATRGYAVCEACNPRHACKKCEGTGHARRFNLLTQAEDVVPFGCSCTWLEKAVGRLNEAALPERYFNVDFTNFTCSHLASEPREKLRLLAQIAEAYCEVTAESWKKNPSEVEKPFLTLMGPVGTGKTHLAIAVLKRFIARHGMTGKFVDFSKFLADLRHCYSSRSPEEAVLGPLRTVDVLLLDELGKGRTENEWQLEKLDDLINSRYNAGRITLLTTNYLHGEFRYDPQRFGLKEVPANESFWRQSLQERIGARMYDRLLEASEFLVFLGVDSYRRRMVDSLLEKKR
jgi:DNA replication protein DnaC